MIQVAALICDSVSTPMGQLAGTLAIELSRRSAKRGLAALRTGVCQGIAIALEAT